MGRKKEKEVESNEKSIDLEDLDPALRSAAFQLGFRKRASINKIARTIEGELKHEKVGKIFVGVLLGAAGLLFVLSLVGPLTIQGNARGVGIGAAIWAFLSYLYVRRAQHHHQQLLELDAVVKKKLGIS